MKTPHFHLPALKKSTWIMLALMVGMILLNLLAWCNSAFSNWYAEFCFPHLSRVFSHLYGWIPFSVGEVWIAIAILIGVGGLISYPICMIICKGKRKGISFLFGRIYGWIVTAIFVTETCCCFLLYHATPFAQRYYQARTFTGQDLLALYSELIDTANELAPQVARDADGYFVLQDDLVETAHAAMQKLGETYPQFRGSYPLPKPIHASYLMSQMNLTGIYFPFTLESNYNRDMLDINLPNTVCHEFTHLRGTIQEDEAGFLAYLACIQSDSIDFQYSGVISALEYVQNAVWMHDITGADAASDRLSEAARHDMYTFLPDGYWEEKQETIPVIVATKTVQEATTNAMDTTLKLNGVDDGTQSYSRIVTLLLYDWNSRVRD